MIKDFYFHLVPLAVFDFFCFMGSYNTQSCDSCLYTFRKLSDLKRENKYNVFPSVHPSKKGHAWPALL